MKPIHRTVLLFLAAALLVAALILVTAPPRGHAVVLLPAPAPAPINVHVAGAVTTPGVYALPRESRLADAIQAAGGLTEAADSSAVNLAAVLNDGEKWIIPEIGAAPPPVELGPITEDSRSPEPILSIVNLNTAVAADFETLPGIGPVLAQQIVEYREAHGPFQSIENILDVPGIGETKFESLKSLVTVD